MKRTIVGSMLAMMFFAMLYVGVSSCSKDKDDDSSSSGVVGTWSGKDGKDQLTLNFKKGGSGTWTYRYYDSYSGTETERGTFTWEMDGKTEGWIYVENEYDSYSSYSGRRTHAMFFEMEGKTMYLDDDKWILTKQ